MASPITRSVALSVFTLCGCSGTGDPDADTGTQNPTTHSGGDSSRETPDQPGSGGATLGDAITGGTSMTGETSTGGQGTGGEPEFVPEATSLEGVTYEIIECGAALPGGAQVVFGPGIGDYGGWSHANNPDHAASYTNLRSDDRSVYDFSDTTKTSEPACGGDETLRRTLLRKIHEHTQKHSNGLQVRGTHPNVSTVSALVIDMKLGDSSHLPVVEPIFDGFATVSIETGNGTTMRPRYRIAPVYLGHWIRITIPAENFGAGTPVRLQHVAETTDHGKIDESVVDFQEIDMNIHQMAYLPL